MKVDVTTKAPVKCPMLVRSIMDNSIGLRAMDCSIVILKSDTGTVGAVINDPSNEWVVFDGSVTISND